MRRTRIASSSPVRSAGFSAPSNAVATPLRNRARHRTHEGGRLPRLLLISRARRRCRQRCPHLSRTQPPPRPRLVENAFAPDPDRAITRLRLPNRAQSGFLMDGLREPGRRRRRGDLSGHTAFCCSDVRMRSVMASRAILSSFALNGSGRKLSSSKYFSLKFCRDPNSLGSML